MICIKCDNEKFSDKPNAAIEQVFKGEAVTVKMTAFACSKCGWTTVTLDQADELRRLTADAYREKHGLLTSVQLKAIRKELDKSQREFAALVGVGEASIKRWETWLVQDGGNDQLIRVKSEKAKHDQLYSSATIKFRVPETYSCTTIHSMNGISANSIAWDGRFAPWIKDKNVESRSERDNREAEGQYVNDELALAA